MHFLMLSRGRGLRWCILCEGAHINLLHRSKEGSLWRHWSLCILPLCRGGWGGIVWRIMWTCPWPSFISEVLGKARRWQADLARAFPISWEGRDWLHWRVQVDFFFIKAISSFNVDHCRNFGKITLYNYHESMNAERRNSSSSTLMWCLVRKRKDLVGI